MNYAIWIISKIHIKDLVMFDTIYLTGFKKFANVKVNPTELIAEHYEKEQHPNISKVTRLDVTTQQVDIYLKSIQKLIAEIGPKKRVLNLHLGVGPNKAYHLEACGYNMKDFGVPDNSGQQCKNEQICKKTPLDQALKAKVDVEYLASKLSKKHDVAVSDDPGRYLCNYVYYSSMNHFLEIENSASLFVHIPPQNIKSHEQNLKFMKDLIKLLTNKE